MIFKTPSNCTLSADEVGDFDEVWFADLCPASLHDPAGGLPFWVCDHHVTNQKKCDGDSRCTFSMDHSGTSLLARELGFIGDHDESNERRELIQALEDYDLGRFDNWRGQRLADAAGSMSQEQLLVHFLLHGPGVWHEPEIVYRAMAMADARNLYAQKAAETAYYFEFEPPGWGHVVVPTVKAGIAISPEPWKNQCTEEILRRAELAIIVDSTSWSLSFRSKTLDVSTMAQEYGGGGHKRAAGFKIASHDILRTIVEEIFG